MKIIPIGFCVGFVLLVACGGSSSSDGTGGGSGSSTGGTAGSNATGGSAGSGATGGADSGVTGPPCLASYHCLEGETCVTESCGTLGACVANAECFDVLQPTCSCQGITADNPCQATALGGVLSPGACGTKSCSLDGSMVGTGAQWSLPDGCNHCTCVDGSIHCSSFECRSCDATNPCPSGEFCDYTDQQCGAGAAGVCRIRARHCWAMEAPSVCGCDGQTYQNFCYAWLAGVSISEDPSACSG